MDYLTLVLLHFAGRHLPAGHRLRRKCYPRLLVQPAQHWAVGVRLQLLAEPKLRRYQMQCDNWLDNFRRFGNQSLNKYYESSLCHSHRLGWVYSHIRVCNHSVFYKRGFANNNGKGRKCYNSRDKTGWHHLQAGEVVQLVLHALNNP